MDRKYNFTFTLHNWTEEWLHALHEHFSENCKFWIFGDEVGKAGETPHLQGYFEWKDAKTFNASCKRLKAITTPGIHLEVAKKNRQANVNYCSKECRKVWGSAVKTAKIKEKDIRKTLRADLQWDALTLDERCAWMDVCETIRRGGEYW